MNEARLGVWFAGSSDRRSRYSECCEYCTVERLQGRSLFPGPKAPDKKADSIHRHPDVPPDAVDHPRPSTSGRGPSCCETALEIRCRPQVRKSKAMFQQADDLAPLVTPVVKACSTEGFDHGGGWRSRCLAAMATFGRFGP